MLTLTVFKFAKRQNSTAAPASGTGVDVSIVLKDHTQILTPTFILEWATYPDYNYALFEGRYYFITQIESLRENLWSLSCRVDVLGTYKASIQATTAFVLYDTAANTELSDSRLSMKTTQVTQANSANFALLGTDVSAVVSVVGRENTSTFQMEINRAANIMAGINTWATSVIPDTSTGTQDPAEAIEQHIQMSAKAFQQLVATGSAKDCIKSAFIVPVPLSAVWGDVRTIWLGDFETGLHEKRIPNTKNRIAKDVLTVAIPWQANDWRRNSPYHEIYLYIPYIGLNRIPTGDIIGETNLSIESSIDVATGDTIMRVFTSSKTIAQYTAQLGISFPIGASNVTPLQMENTILTATQNAIQTSGSFLTGNIAGGASQAVGTLQGIMNGLEPLPSCVGGNSGGAALGLANTVYCYTIFHDTNVLPDSVSAIMGTPSREVKSLGSLSGYVQTIGASVSGDMLESERSQLNQLLDGGIYIE